MKLINTITLKDNYTWILHNMQNKEQGDDVILGHQNKADIIKSDAIVFDCGDFDKTDTFLALHNLHPKYICITHNHYDHTDGVILLAQKYGAKIVAHKELSYLFNVDMVVKNGDEITLLDETFKIYEAGGHCPNQIIYHSQKSKRLFVGDVLFNLGCGLLINGSYENMFADMKLIKAFSSDNKVLCGHNYLRANWWFLQSLGIKDLEWKVAQNQAQEHSLDFEIKHNPFLNYDNESFKKALGLDHMNDFDFFVHLRKLRNNFKLIPAK